MQKAVLKKEVENLLKELPEETNWDDMMYKIYVRQSIEQGLEDVKEGRTMSHEDVKAKYKWAE